MLRVFKGDIKRVTREITIQYRLIVDVPAEHMNLIKSNPSLDLNSLFLIAKGTLVV